MSSCLSTRIFHFRRKPLFQNLLLRPPIVISSFSTYATENQSYPFHGKSFSNIFQDCSREKAIQPGKQAHARMIVSGFEPTNFVANCLLQTYIKCSLLECAAKVFARMPAKNVISWNSLISGYLQNGEVVLAQSIFNLMPERNEISWNSLISGYLQNGNFLKSVEVFIMMGRDAVAYNESTFAVVLKAIATLENYVLGLQVHGVVMKLGFENNVVTGNAMSSMYAKCKMLDDSIRVFDAMLAKDMVSWSAIIAGNVQNGKLEGGIGMFKEMLSEGVAVSQSVYASIFKSCAGLSASSLGSQLHCHAHKSNFEANTVVGTAILDMYAKCDDLRSARKVFDFLPNVNLLSYNALIVEYARSDLGYEGVQLFKLLLKSDLGFDTISLSAAFSVCAVSKGLSVGTQIHGLAIKTHFHNNISVANAILNMYGKCGALVEACRIFDEMKCRDVVSWNAVIAACEQNENEETLSMFICMLRSRMEPDEFTYATILKACAGGQALQNGMGIHARVIKCGMESDSFVSTVIVDMYCKCGVVEDAEKLHERVEENTLVSWNTMIARYASTDQSEKAQKCFSRMLEMGVKPDELTYVAILNSCSNVANVGLGKQYHAQIIKQELQSHVYIISALVDMYSKCGNMQDSLLMFRKSSNRNLVTWNIMICAYAHHGYGNEALQVFEKMVLEKVMPNHATFVGVLHACAHIGLVDEAFRYLYVMQKDFGLLPELQHYSCMVDALGRSGRITEALKLIQDMPLNADVVIWGTLLSSCKIHGNVEVAEISARSIVQLDSQDSRAYNLLRQIYADAGMWDEASKIRRIVRSSGLKEKAGCSWIEVGMSAQELTSKNTGKRSEQKMAATLRNSYGGSSSPSRQ